MSSLAPLPRSFYRRDTLSVAKDLLGKGVVRSLNYGIMIGRVVEVEAYGEMDDPASHSYRGITKRNRVMFGEVGYSYVYFTYGNHYLLNAVAKDDSSAGAVLIRALEPLDGIDLMRVNRGIDDIKRLTAGPGMLTKSLGITKKQNNIDLTKRGELFISELDHVAHQICSSPRIGISSAREKPWRFFIKNNEFISRR